VASPRLEESVNDDEVESPRRTGIRQGLKLILAAGILSPLIFFLEGLLPSRENTILDELPYFALTATLVGLAVAGAAKVIFALLMESRHLLPSRADLRRLSDGPTRSEPAATHPSETPRQTANPPHGDYSTPV
jgi:hypothetical protein